MKIKERMRLLEGRMISDLQLSAEQRHKIRDVIKDFIAQRKGIKVRVGDDKVARKAEVKVIRKSMRQQIGELLSPEQKKQFNGKKQEYRQMMRATTPRSKTN